MKFLQRFKKKCSFQQVTTEETRTGPSYVELPKYVEYEGGQLLLLSIVASVIAAEDQSNCRLSIKKIWHLNPEIQRVSLITSVIAAQKEQHSNFIVKKIAKRENFDVTKI